MMKKKSIVFGIALNLIVVTLFFFNAIETFSTTKDLEPSSPVAELALPPTPEPQKTETIEIKEQPNPIEKNIPAWNERYDKVLVKEGETLASLCKHYACFEDQVIEINMLKQTTVSVGQTLFFPKRTQPLKKKEYYTIKKGESPWIIARNCGLSVEELLKLNNLTLETSKRIKPGDELRIK